MRQITLVLVALLASPLAAQQKPTFRTGVQLIEVDARVFDKDGRFVTDLTKDDFEVLENGVPQRIDALFLVEGVKPGSDPGQTRVKPGSDQGQTPPPTAAAAAPSAPQTWIFFFDLNHLTPGSGFDRARKAVEDFIASRFRDGDVAGIVAGEKMIGNRLTSVRQELLDHLKHVKPRNEARSRFVELTRDWPRFTNDDEAIRVARGEDEVQRRVVQRACFDDADQCRIADSAVSHKAARFASEIHRSSLNTLSTVNALGSGLARIPGPKTLVLLADGFTVHNIETTLRSIVGQVTRAGARVYAIDVRGLNRGVGSANIIDEPLVEDMYTTRIGAQRFDDTSDAMNSLAVDTGGVMIRNENNLGRALDFVANDGGRYYVVAYQPSNTDFDGKFRPIEVKVKRPGLRVRARRGYLALDPAKMLKPQPIK